MIICKNCNNEIKPISDTCHVCGAAVELTEAEILSLWMDAVHARESRNTAEELSILKLLSDIGYVPAVRDYAGYLESGKLGIRDFDAAMKYFYSAALKNDAYSAYRYSRLAGRASSLGGSFWLLFSAALGCREAYLSAAERYDSLGEPKYATYYYTLAADCDNTDAIVALAKRYYEGVGVPENASIAKWYMDKLTIPPIYAIKLAYKLRSERAEEPKQYGDSIRHPIIRKLILDARQHGIGTAERRLCEILSEDGDVDAMTRLGVIYLEGIGGEAVPHLATKTLERAAIHGSAEAYRTLGNMYLTGCGCEENSERALENYRRAAELGLSNAYELMGDIYYEGKAAPRDIAKAAELYALAEAEGDTSAKEKLLAIKKHREEIFLRGTGCESTAPEEAFRCYAVAVAMGHVPAYAALARAYLIGIGTHKNRKRAFELLTDAVRLGDTACIFPLGMCYLRGVGTKLNFKTARRYLTDAAKHGDERGLKEIRDSLENKKKKLSRELYSRGMRLLYMQKFELAKESLEVSSELGYPKSTYTLGCFYEFGLGVPCDKDLAYKLYEDAFRGKFRDPRAAYKLIILKILRGKIKAPRKSRP